jgi:hypothetical protein
MQTCRLPILCDYMHLIVNPNVNGQQDLTICEGQLPYTWNGQTITAGGDYNATLVRAAGCDSLATLHLHINSCRNGRRNCCHLRVDNFPIHGTIRASLLQVTIIHIAKYRRLRLCCETLTLSSIKCNSVSKLSLSARVNCLIPGMDKKSLRAGRL